MLCWESQLDHAQRVHGVAAFSPQFGGFKVYSIVLFQMIRPPHRSLNRYQNC